MLFELGLYPDEIERRFSPRQWLALRAERERRVRAQNAAQGMG